MNTTRARFRLGDMISERYLLTRLLDASGMGEVWEATDTRLNRQVTVKALRPGSVHDARAMSRFRSEARNTARLRHTNIVALLDHGRDQSGGPYLVKEYIDGYDLADLLERDGILMPDVAVPILVQTLHALDTAHAAGVIHRDVKPANILITKRGTVKVSDFGISQASDQEPMTATGMVMGTAEYLAPEIAAGKPATPAGDIYAVGVVAFEALTGRRPFIGDNPVATALAHVEQAVPPLPAELPDALSRTIQLLLRKHPARRPHTAQVAADMLTAAMKPPGSDSTPPRYAGRLNRSRSSHTPVTGTSPGKSHTIALGRLNSTPGHRTTAESTNKGETSGG